MRHGFDRGVAVGIGLIAASMVVIAVTSHGTLAAVTGAGAVALFAAVLVRTERDRSRDTGRLVEQRDLLSATLTSIGDAVIATDAAGNVTYLNPVAERLTGWSEAEARGVALETVFHIVNETTRAPVANPALRALEAGVIVGLANHTILISKGGTERPIDDSAAPIRSGGAISGAVLVFRDISDRKAAEADRARITAESERRKRLYETALSNTPDLVYVFGLDHRFRYANEALLSMWGKTAAESLGRTCLELGYEPWHAAMHDREIDQVRATKRPIRGEVPFTGTGGRRVYDYIFVPVLGADGEVEAVAGTTRDVSDRKQAEEELRASEEQYRTLVKSIDQGFCVIELIYEGDRPVDYRFLEANPVFQTQTGLANPVGRTIRELAPAIEERWFEIYGDVARTGESRRFVQGSAALGRWFDAFALRVGRPGGGRVAVLFSDISGRMRNDAERERLLREVETERERLADVFQHAPSFMGVLRGPDHVFERVNDRYDRLVGGRPLIGLAVRDALPEVVGQGYIDLLDRVFATGEAFHGTDARVTLELTEGRPPEERFLDFVYQPVRDASGAVTGVLVHGVDLTDRRRAEDALRASEERLRVAVAAAKLGEWTLDLRTLVMTCSDGCKANYGRGRGGSLTYEELWTAVHPDDLGRVREEVRAAIEGRADYDTEYRTLWPDGSLHWVLVRGRAAYAADGTPTAMTGVTLDITDRKRAEEREQQAAREARATAEAVRFLSDASASLAELVDYESTLQRIANLAVGRFADWCVVDVMDESGGRRRLAVNGIPAAGAESPEAAGTAIGVPHVLKTGEPELVPDVAVLDPATARQGADRIGRLRGWGIESYLAVPLLSRGKVIGGITFLSASPRRRYGREELLLAQELAVRVTTAIENASLYRTLQDQDRRKDEFLATLAHELRNPLAPVRNGVRILQTVFSTEERAARTLEMMDRQLGHMVHLVDDLMDVARVSSGKVVLRKEKVELRAVVEASIESTRQVVEAGGHELTVDLPALPLAFEADRTRLVQVVTNLLSNAAKYTPHGGRITVSARRTDGHAVIRVTDTGVGIAAEMLPKVFEMFTQVGTSLERSRGGLGIGLTLVKRLVEMHGGSVSAESPGPGKGSTFSVRLPLAEEAARPREIAPREETPAASRISILVVDDNVDAAESLSMLLGMTGHEVRTAHDGPEALRVLGTFRPHLVVLDIGLPGMTGYDVARRIRESDALQGVALAALTGWGQEEDRRRSRAAGFDYHLTKPADSAALEKIISEIAGRA